MQVAATGTMLVAMNTSSFVVTTAYIKTEPILAAIFGFVFLSDRLTGWKIAAIVIATIGVVLTAIRPQSGNGVGDLRAITIGLVSAACFAISTVSYRGAILEVSGVSFVTAATFTLVIGLLLQALVLAAYLLVWDRKTFWTILRLWKPSMVAGFTGAFASQFGFLAFAVTSVASVRTLSLIEVPLAQAVSYYRFKQKASALELAGIALIVLGVGLLVAVH
jgi:drug/metabolite transporter (DMT)-like permease